MERDLEVDLDNLGLIGFDRANGNLNKSSQEITSEKSTNNSRSGEQI